MSIARQQLGDPPAEDAVIEEARAVCNMFADLEVHERNGGQRGAWLARHVVIPEFIPGSRVSDRDRIPF
jgi:hypothetical protein